MVAELDRIVSKLKTAEGRAAAGVSYRGEITSPFRWEPPIVLGNGVVLYSDVSIGAHSYVNSGRLHPRLRVGRFCSIAYGVTLGVGQHKAHRLTTNDFAGRMKEDPHYQNPYYKSNRWDENTVIGHDVWIGQNVIVMQGVTIGTGAIVGAGAIVTKDVEPYSIVAGVPAKVIGFRFGGNRAWIDALLRSEWWEFRDECLSELPVNNPMAVVSILKDVTSSSRRANEYIEVRETIPALR